MATDQVTLDTATFEKLVTNSSKYDAFVAAGYPTVEMVNQIILDYKRDNEALRNERDTAKTSLEERRREWLDLIAFLASELGTRQDVQEIKDVAEKYDQVISDAEKVADNYSRDKLSWAVTEQELQGEIARLKALLNQQNILENTKLEELLREIVKRLVSIIKK